jgi:hypothetical protein
MPETREILRKRFISRLIIVAILAAALLFRLWGMGFGLPQKVHPDEPLLIDRAIEAGAKGDFNPGFFYWPNFLTYFLYFEYVAIYYIGYLFGIYHNLKEFFTSYYIDPTFFIWAGRVTTTLFCLMGMSCLYLIGKKTREPPPA